MLNKINLLSLLIIITLTSSCAIKTHKPADTTPIPTPAPVGEISYFQMDFEKSDTKESYFYLTAIEADDELKLQIASAAPYDEKNDPEIDVKNGDTVYAVFSADRSTAQMFIKFFALNKVVLFTDITIADGLASADKGFTGEAQTLVITFAADNTYVTLEAQPISGFYVNDKVIAVSSVKVSNKVSNVVEPTTFTYLSSDSTKYNDFYNWVKPIFQFNKEDVFVGLQGAMDPASEGFISANYTPVAILVCVDNSCPVNISDKEGNRQDFSIMIFANGKGYPEYIDLDFENPYDTISVYDYPDSGDNAEFSVIFEAKKSMSVAWDWLAHTHTCMTPSFINNMGKTQLHNDETATLGASIDPSDIAACDQIYYQVNNGDSTLYGPDGITFTGKEETVTITIYVTSSTGAALQSGTNSIDIYFTDMITCLAPIVWQSAYSALNGTYVSVEVSIDPSEQHPEFCNQPMIQIGGGMPGTNVVPYLGAPMSVTGTDEVVQIYSYIAMGPNGSRTVMSNIVFGEPPQ